ncbi:hypothetical protein HETIRDRAFT_409392 [Heterobasidion irregulare TC 32-1]|uniref:Uncharacterized protein n=1 Tax=Heterobasidion irregulare (strain TC 32-1) TaxID=747525 RepID=W4K6Q8_HETIT|nr:uncharacterized protein HETIRDRAFT_409392 [Heterobasidion irregulare TC 32-1]ETW81488.1 hypothetical protein HETIRDRAFT_409392 [Heterobasidion irregulare TC 32-1]
MHGARMSFLRPFLSPFTLMISSVNAVHSMLLLPLGSIFFPHMFIFLFELLVYEHSHTT